MNNNQVMIFQAEAIGGSILVFCFCTAGISYGLFSMTVLYVNHEVPKSQKLIIG